MADVTKSISLRLTAHDGASATIDGVGKKLEGLGGRDVGALHQLKAAFGRGSTFKETFEVLEGGGAAIGLSFAGRALKEMTGEAVKLRDEFNEGKISAGEMTERLAASVPILGSIFESGRNIRELLTGELAITRAITEEAARQGRFMDVVGEGIKRELTTRKQLLGVIRDIRMEIARMTGNKAGEIGLAAEAKGEAIDELLKSAKERPENEKKLREELNKIAFQNRAAEQRRFAPFIDLIAPGTSGIAALFETQKLEAESAQKTAEIVAANAQLRILNTRELKRGTAADELGGLAKFENAAKEFIALKDLTSQQIDSVTKFFGGFGDLVAKKFNETVERRTEIQLDASKSREDQIQKQLRDATDLKLSSGTFSPLLSGFAQVARESAQSNPMVGLLKQQLDEQKKTSVTLQKVLDELKRGPDLTGLSDVTVPGL